MSLQLFQGVISAIPTPFDRSGQVDFQALQAHLAFLLDAGVHAIVPGTASGECHAQVTEERRQVLAFVAERVGTKLPLYAATGSAKAQETVVLANYAKTLGYQGIVLETPPAQIGQGLDLVSYVRDIAADTSLPIMLANVGAHEQSDLAISSLMETAAISALDDSSSSLESRFKALCDGKEGPQHVCGSAQLALDHFLWGAKGWISGFASFLPTEHVALFDACVIRNDWERGRQIMAAMMPLIWHADNSGKRIQYIKYGCKLAGVPVGEVRAPLYSLTEAEERTFQRLYTDAKAAIGKNLAA